MSIEELLDVAGEFDGVVDLAPAEGSDFPEIAWGDHFFYYSPDGTVPGNRQPYATIITKDYPDDADSALSAPDRWRLNIHVGSSAVTELTGGTQPLLPHDVSAADVMFPHPVYGSLGWVSIVNPGPRTSTAALRLLRDAHLADRDRVERRHG